MTTKPKSTLIHRYTFPPFPTPPDGVKIIEFQDYVEMGIKIQPDDYEGPEVDGLGIPTVPMSKSHRDDFCKTNSRTLKILNTINTEGKPAQKVPNTWVERWEALRSVKSGQIYDPSQDRKNRLHQATSAFNDSRPWPKEIRVRERWDQVNNRPTSCCEYPERPLKANQFQIFIGYINAVPVPRPKQDLLVDEDIDEIFDDDDDDLPAEDMIVESTETSATLNEPEGVKGKNVQLSQESSEEKLNVFLDDPERAVKVYLSSYMYKKGFHFDEGNLTLIPLLLQFFINFLLNDRVFASEPEFEASLRQSLSVIDIARVELPLTPQITKELSAGTFSKACEELFGVKSREQDLLKLAYAEKMNADKLEDQASSTAAATRASTPAFSQTPSLHFDADANTMVVESRLNVTEASLQGEIDVFDSTVEPADVAAAPISSPWGSEDDSVLETPTAESGGWGSVVIDPDASGGWGSMEPEDDIKVGTWGGDSWAIPLPATLFPLLGPTAFPLTHMSGIVESSMRRIQSIVHADDVVANFRVDSLPSDSEESGPSAEGVEATLSGRLSKVVLAPWLGWDTNPQWAETSTPEINGSSRGRVVVYDEGVLYTDKPNAFAALEVASNKLLPHDPLKDSITLLLEPEIASMLRVGMGLNGTWAQIARVTDLESTNMNGQKERDIQTKNGDGDAVGGGQRFWYLSNILLVIPSYHI